MADFGVLGIYAEVQAQSITGGAKWNGFDNFTGNSLSHFLTPNDNYCSKIVRLNQAKSRRRRWQGELML
jgi:hypothetical protein